MNFLHNVVKRKPSRYGHLRDHMVAIAAWPLVGCLLIVGVWLIALDKIQDSHDEIEKDATVMAVSLSKAYSEQLERAIQQIDSVTLNIKYQWEKHGEQLDLQDELKKGLFPAPNQFYLTVINRNGIGVTSSLGGPPNNVADRPYFNFHRTTVNSGLHIDPQLSIGRRSGRSIIRFTRRLETEDGAFDGVVSVGVEPAFLATFNDEGSLNPHDFISIRHAEGALLVSEKGRQIRGSQVHIDPPVFNGDSGVMRVSKEKYKDNDARIVAWQKVKGYPLVSYVGLSESDMFADHASTTSSYLQIAAACSAAFFLIAVFGTFFSIRVASRKRQADEVKKTYQLAIDEARDAFYMVRAVYSIDDVLTDFIIEDCNNRGASMARQEKSAVIGKKLSELTLLQPLSIAFPKFRKAMETGFCEDEFKLDEPHPELPSWIHRRLVRSGNGLAVTLRDISDVKDKEELLVTSANTDPLTGLPNRYWLINSLPKALREAKGRPTSFAILFIDLDNFKMVNDKLGHAIGDKLLRLAADRLTSLIRAEDKVVRLGGDEFTVLLHAVEHGEEVSHVATRIAQSFAEPFHILNQALHIGTSIGISMFPQDGVDADMLIQKADIAMYASKAEGKGTYRFYNDELYQRIRSRLNAEEELAGAIAKRQFEMVYQPRVNTTTGEISGLEALVRWHHPTRGVISPIEFICLAETTGSIVQLGGLVLEQVFGQMQSWLRAAQPIVPVSINISPRQLDAGGVDTQIADLLKKYDVPAHLIEIELTESAMMSEAQGVIDQVNGIRNLGIKLHLDDFGTGYSSLSRLQEIDMQVVKIDRAFISKLGTSHQADILVRTIVLMAKGLNMEVIAEGVETEAQLEILKDMACGEAQGFLFSRPVSADAIATMLCRRFADLAH